VSKRKRPAKGAVRAQPIDLPSSSPQPDSFRHGFERFVERLLEVADAAENAPHLANDEKRLVRVGRQNIAAHATALSVLLGQVSEAARPAAFQFLWAMIEGAYLIGRSGVTTVSAKKYFDDLHRAHMRDKRAIKNEPARRARKAAILVELAKVRNWRSMLGNSPGTLADSILDAVNATLREGRYKTVSARTLVRELLRL
jgi:hypothetical protein